MSTDTGDDQPRGHRTAQDGLDEARRRFGARDYQAPREDGTALGLAQARHRFGGGGAA